MKRKYLEIRFDLISLILGRKTAPEIIHIEDAFLPEDE
jgi:hypothetical protein